MNKRNLDLKFVFDRINADAFGGSLRDVPVIWNYRMSSCKGRLSYSFDRKTKELSKMRIDINGNPEKDNLYFINVLAHEMCHLWCAQNGYVNENHGDIWKAVGNYMISLGFYISIYYNRTKYNACVENPDVMPTIYKFDGHKITLK